MTAMPTIYFTLYGRTILNDIGGICYGIASLSTYNITYRAFHRCQTVAPAETYDLKGTAQDKNDDMWRQVSQDVVF